MTDLRSNKQMRTERASFAQSLLGLARADLVPGLHHLLHTTRHRLAHNVDQSSVDYHTRGTLRP